METSFKLQKKNMKQKLFILFALLITTMTASAEAGYSLNVGTNEHGTITFTVGGEAALIIIFWLKVLHSSQKDG